MTVIKSPAYKNMTEAQLNAAIKLGEDILGGHADLVELDEESLQVRGKKGKKNAVGRKSGKMSKEEMEKAETRRRENVAENNKRFTHEAKDEDNNSASVKEDAQKVGMDEDNEEPATKGKDLLDQAGSTSARGASPMTDKKRKHSLETTTSSFPPTKSRKMTSTHTPDPDLQSKINSSSKTPFQKSALSLLLQIPPGCYTTYALMSTYLSSSPRAIGNAIRNNPFAPEVPCHRVLATGGGLGGFGGSWGKKGEEGKNDKEKIRLLRGEGVRFDGKGRVVGSPWGGFS